MENKGNVINFPVEPRGTMSQHIEPFAHKATLFHQLVEENFPKMLKKYAGKKSELEILEHTEQLVDRELYGTDPR